MINLLLLWALVPQEQKPGLQFQRKGQKSLRKLKFRREKKQQTSSRLSKTTRVDTFLFNIEIGLGEAIALLIRKADVLFVTQDQFKELLL